MYKFVLDETNDSYTVYVDPISSLAGRYLSRRPHIFALLSEVLSSSTLHGTRLIIEKDMKRNIGRADVVTTDEKDTIYYAQLLKSDSYLRFVKNRYPELSSTLTITVEQDVDGNYEVSDVWIGDNYPPLPGQENATSDSEMYWETHAFVQDALMVQSKSVTKTCPY